MILSSLGGPLLLLAGLILMFLIVPRDNIKTFLWMGLLGGFSVAVILLYFMQNLFGFWVFHRVDSIYIMEIPIFLSLAWIPLVITFSYLLSKYTNLLTFAVLVLIFPLAAVVVHQLLIINDMLFYNEWNLVLTFLISVVIHIGIAYYLYSAGLIKKIK